MKYLRLAENLSLPLEAVTQAFGILAKRRAGKSYAARRFGEQLFNAGQQIVIVDPKGDWWGIRSSADGRSPGLPVVILGGERGDVPLEVNAGEVVAKLVVEERVSVLLDLSLLRKHEVSTFMGIFLETLYRLKAREHYRTPVMLIVDEADAIAPQKPYKGEERMLGAAEDIVRRGGQRGIGCTLITQRSAVLNKNVLTQVQALLVLRTIAPQDLAAIDAWIDVHGTEEERTVLKRSLPALPIGDAWVWSPGWPTVDGIFANVHILPIETFDSGATPKPGEKRIEPKNLADVDLDALSRQMAATIKKAKAENPRELQKKIRELEAKIKGLEKQKPAALATVQTKEVPVLKDSQITRLEKLAEKMTAEAERHGYAMSLLWGNFKEIGDALKGVMQSFRGGDEMKELVNRETRVPPPTPVRERREATTSPGPAPARDRPIDGDLPPRQQRILDALRELEDLGLATPGRSVVAVFADRGPSSSSYEKDLGTMRTMALLDYPGSGTLRLTREGRARAHAPKELRTLTEFHQAWLSRLEPRKQRIVKVLIAQFPNALDRDSLARLSERGDSSSSYEKDLGNMRTLGILDYPGQGLVVATELLFPIGLL